MRILYIGHYNEGSTSRMRGEYLKDLLRAGLFDVVNIDIPLEETPRLLRSYGWRFKKGPLIWNINKYLRNTIGRDKQYDLVWVDKGVFIEPENIQMLKSRSHRLIHFTPDPAFTYHRSSLFYKAIPLYDYCITTKSFELEDYRSYGVKTIFCTQGYDPKVHRRYHKFRDKSGFIFLGHKEEEREYLISRLVEKEVQVKVAGNHWLSLARKYRAKRNFEYLGKGVFGENYARAISGSLLSVGFLSKWIPERHTTRTFEIPACGTALLTEKNDELLSIYSSDEVIYYDSLDHAVESAVYYLKNIGELEEITERGFSRVTKGGYAYRELLESLLVKMEILS